MAQLRFFALLVAASRAASASEFVDLRYTLKIESPHGASFLKEEANFTDAMKRVGMYILGLSNHSVGTIDVNVSAASFQAGIDVRRLSVGQPQWADEVGSHIEDSFFAADWLRLGSLFFGSHFRRLREPNIKVQFLHRVPQSILVGIRVVADEALIVQAYNMEIGNASQVANTTYGSIDRSSIGVAILTLKWQLDALALRNGSSPISNSSAQPTPSPPTSASTRLPTLAPTKRPKTQKPKPDLVPVLKLIGNFGIEVQVLSSFNFSRATPAIERSLANLLSAPQSKVKVKVSLCSGQGCSVVRRLSVTLTLEYIVKLMQDKIEAAMDRLNSPGADKELEVLLDYELRNVGLEGQLMGVVNWVPPQVVGERMPLPAQNTTSRSPDQNYVSLDISASRPSWHNVLAICVLAIFVALTTALPR